MGGTGQAGPTLLRSSPKDGGGGWEETQTFVLKKQSSARDSGVVHYDGTHSLTSRTLDISLLSPGSPEAGTGHVDSSRVRLASFRSCPSSFLLAGIRTDNRDKNSHVRL